MNPSHIPFFLPEIGQEEIDEVSDCLRSGWLTTGPRTQRFEGEFASFVGKKHALAVNSCTAALHLALEAIGVRRGDHVILPTMTFAATAEVVRYFDAHPVLVDVRADDFNMDPDDLARKLADVQSKGGRVAAVIPVHYGGQIADANAISVLARHHGLRIVEDAAHSLPAFFRDQAAADWRQVGAGSDVVCFSFYANKTITTGEGGMACTNDDSLADRMRIMALHGISKDAWKRFTSEGSWHYEIIAPGFKYNLTDIAASIGLHQLRKANRFREERARVANAYRQRLASVEEIILPVENSNRIHSWHLFVIRLRLNRLTIDRAQVIQLLRGAGIGTSVHWMPLHMHPYYRETYGYKPEDLPVSARLYWEIISLPIYPRMSESEIETVCTVLTNIVAKHCRR